MGKPMSATPTPESKVWQGGANTLENRCPTTPTPKGGVGVVGRSSPVWRGVGRIVPARSGNRQGRNRVWDSNPRDPKGPT